ncbi:peptidoglycan-binding domain-containing protein [Devosia sp. SL43]|uniref:peptidoglycan-binding domain-containing protein n=1 Tax=Devosia sp. SL43 TaxID=2806348 RepID=UPI001F18DB61|nr:peptidoglycan-binding domain-containing protein [Devosia sp. SL43]UJW85499.1 peptidoglycan-binding protein [Devosia sp. SL43]
MTATTFTRLPLAAGSAVATSLGRAGLWAFSHYMRAPLASTGLMAMVTLTALAGSNALYFQTARHPAPFFAPAGDVPVPVAQPADAPVLAPIPAERTAVVAPAASAVVTTDTTGSVASGPQAIPNAPVGNTQAFEVQKKLTELGLFNGKVDGFYGPMTATAIRAFEQRNGMEPTGALTPDVIEAILRADASGMIPVTQQAAVVQPQPAPVTVQPAPVQQAVVVAPQPQVAARLPELTPVDNAVDAVGNAAAQTIDSIVAAVGGARATPVSQGVAPTPALPMMATTAQPMPAPVQVASLEPMAAPQPVTAVQPNPVPDQVMAATTVAPANNVQLVSQIQRGLASLGFYHGSIDGHPGDATAKAIREFENFHSYRVTGEVKPDLVGLLRQAGASI